MQPPMIGSWRAEIVSAREFQIHGDSYFELLITRLDVPETEKPEAILRAPSHAFSKSPESGNRVEIAFLMGQVTTVKSIEA